MKKILLVACLVIAATATAEAQWYLGGNISFSHTSSEISSPTGAADSKATRIMFTPRVGYIINGRWSAGVGVGYQWGKDEIDGNKTATVNGYMATPYARFNCFFFGPFALAAEASAGYTNILEKSNSDDPAQRSVRTENIGVEITPVLDLDVSRRISLECRLNFFSVGYIHSKKTSKEGGEKKVAKSNSFGADIAGDEIFTLGDLTFGMIFKF